VDRRSVDEYRTLLASCPPGDPAGLLSEMKHDTRAGVRALVATHERHDARRAAEVERLTRLADPQRALHARGVAVVAGVDEVGRGALAGPVTAGAVILEVGVLIDGLDDSKRLSPQRRETVARDVRTSARAVCVAHASPAEIDAAGIAGAVRLAMSRAVGGLGVSVDHVLIDGNDDRFSWPASAMVRGDALCACIAAASIIAKVERDDLMRELETAHPGYGFAVNKGYGTAEHIDAIRTFGPSPVHRRSFAPCSLGELF
jgi:ribonuclease HII